MFHNVFSVLLGTLFLLSCTQRSQSPLFLSTLRQDRILKQEINLIAHRFPQSFIPHECYEQSCRSYLHLLHDRLFLPNEHGEPYLASARSHVFDPDRAEHTFCLRQDLTWSDGTPILPEDWLRGFQLLASPHSLNYPLLISAQIENAQLVIEKRLPISQIGVYLNDRNCLVIKSPLTPKELARFLAQTPFAPAHSSYVSLQNEDVLKYPQRYVTSGPFYLEPSPIRGFTIPVLKKRFDYKANPVGHITRIYTILESQEPEHFFLYYETGLVDFLYVASYSLVHRSLKKGYRLHRVIGANLYLLEFNQRPGTPFSDLKLRKTIFEALPISQIIFNVMDKMAIIPTSHFIPAFFLPSHSMPTRWKPSSTRFSRRYQGLSLSFLCNTTPLHTLLALYLQQLLLARLGIRLNIVMRPESVRLADLKRGHFDWTLSQITPDVYSEFSFLEHFLKDRPFNYGAYYQPEFEHVMSQRYTDGPSKLLLALHAQDILKKNYAAIPLFESGYYVTYPDQLKGVRHHPIDIATDLRQAYWDLNFQK